MYKCIQCGSEFTRKKSPSDHCKFCSHSCSATYSNKRRVRIRKNYTLNLKCKKCDVEIRNDSDSMLCRGCKSKEKISNRQKYVKSDDFTLKEMFSGTGNNRRRSTRIHHYSRQVFSEYEKGCIVCGYPHVQVCHIIPVRDFALDTPLNVVNSPKNLIGLCRNHHWELDHFVLSEESAEKILHYAEEAGKNPVNLLRKGVL